MLLSEARPRPYRQPESERKFNQEETDKQSFATLRDRAEWTKNYGQDFINRYKHAFNNSDAVAKNPRSAIRSRCRNVIRDMFATYYEQHANKLVQDPDIHVVLSNAYHDSVHVGLTVDARVNTHRPLEQNVFQNVGEFTVRGHAGESVVLIEKDSYTGRDVSDALFSISRTDAGQQYEKVLKDLETYAYDSGYAIDGFDQEKDYIQEDPEVRKLLEMISVEVDKQIKPIIADVSKKLMNLKVLVSQRISDFYKM